MCSSDLFQHAIHPLAALLRLAPLLLPLGPAGLLGLLPRPVTAAAIPVQERGGAALDERTLLSPARTGQLPQLVRRKALQEGVGARNLKVTVSGITPLANTNITEQPQKAWAHKGKLYIKKFIFKIIFRFVLYIIR